MGGPRNSAVVRRDLVASLLLRTLAFSDQLSGAALETRLGLPFETLHDVIELRVTLQKDELGGQINLILETPGRETFGNVRFDLELALISGAVSPWEAGQPAE